MGGILYAEETLVCGGDSAKTAASIVVLERHDNNQKITAFAAKDAGKRMLKRSPLDKRLQYFRVQVVYAALKARKTRYSDLYGEAVFHRLFPHAASVQFLLCEFGKSCDSSGREWYIKEVEERNWLKAHCAASGFQRFVCGQVIAVANPAA